MVAPLETVGRLSLLKCKGKGHRHEDGDVRPEPPAGVWETNESIDLVLPRLQGTQKVPFRSLALHFAQTWPGILNRYERALLAKC